MHQLQQKVTIYLKRKEIIIATFNQNTLKSSIYYRIILSFYEAKKEQV